MKLNKEFILTLKENTEVFRFCDEFELKQF